MKSSTFAYKACMQLQCNSRLLRYHPRYTLICDMQKKPEMFKVNEKIHFIWGIPVIPSNSY